MSTLNFNSKFRDDVKPAALYIIKYYVSRFYTVILDVKGRIDQFMYECKSDNT